MKGRRAFPPRSATPRRMRESKRQRKRWYFYVRRSSTWLPYMAAIVARALQPLSETPGLSAKEAAP